MPLPCSLPDGDLMRPPPGLGSPHPSPAMERPQGKKGPHIPYLAPLPCSPRSLTHPLPGCSADLQFAIVPASCKHRWWGAPPPLGAPPPILVWALPAGPARCYRPRRHPHLKQQWSTLLLPCPCCALRPGEGVLAPLATFLAVEPCGWTLATLGQARRIETRTQAPLPTAPPPRPLSSWWHHGLPLGWSPATVTCGPCVSSPPPGAVRVTAPGSSPTRHTHIPGQCTPGRQEPPYWTTHARARAVLTHRSQSEPPPCHALQVPPHVRRPGSLRCPAYLAVSTASSGRYQSSSPPLCSALLPLHLLRI